MELIVCCIATLDSKAEEVKFLAHHLSSALQSFLPPSLQFKLKIVDVSTSHNKHSSSSIADFSVQNILSCHPDSSKHSPSSLPSDRASAISIVSLALQHFLQNLQSNGQLAGAIGLGGSGGTALIAPALRALPLGLPKIIVSTVACGNTAHYIGSSDLLLLPAVVDICGLNSISKVILSNAAGAAAGMIALKAAMTSNGGLFDSPKRPTLGMTMFGLTTPCVEAVRRKLEEKGFEALIFHATGTGGQTMESLVNQGLIQGVLDITTTEIADYIVGGVMACSENRLDAIIEKKIPLVLSVGALDMVNFGSRDSVPGKFSHRKLHIHNNQVTVMRTTVDENKEFARFIAKKLNNASHPVCILLPEKGVSGLDALGRPFYDPEATGALLDCLEKEIIQSTNRQVKRVPYHINDPQFADAVLEAFLDIMPSSPNIGAEDDNQVKVQSRLPIEPELKSLAKTPDKFLNAKEDTMTMRELVLQRLRQEIGRGVPIIGAGAGTGISAKFEEVGGADLIVVYNSGRFRMAGRGSLAGLLPFSDANSVVVQLASEVFPVVKKVPVLAGVCGTDPFRCIDRFLHELKGLGFVGVQNFPTVGLIDGKFRQNLEETGMGYGLEVEMIRKAHEMGLLTTPYAFNEAESTAMAEAGADIIVAHMGLTSSGSIGAKSVLSLEDSVHVVQQIADAAHKVNPDIIVLSHGGPITGPDECAFILQHTTGVHGFYGASSIERLPVEKAITTIMQQYKSISLS